MGEFDENIEFTQEDVISIASSSWSNTTDDEEFMLNGFLEEGYINETMLPWNSGIPLLVKFIWGTEAHNADKIIDIEIF
ncbi:unnamed protein product [Wuchereria bancrofti]|uniref:Uncharacterized protein n=1 Tax=Wuchereria bancrofti TaxID=6293 RepID=A0A183Y578_WUCBA|nr:unnamed protein product [Wuchereria bancrofti]